MLDIIIIKLYLIISLAVGLYHRSKSNTLAGYSNLGPDLKNNKIILTATIFASAVGGGTTFGITEKSYNENLAFAYGLILTIPVDLLIAKFLVPKMIKYRTFSSTGEIMEKYYGKEARIITGISAFLISIGYLSVQISVSGRIFSYVFDVEYIKAVIFSYIIVIIYTAFGGFRSVVINNLVQFIAMIIAIPIVTILGINYFGVDYIQGHIPSEKYNLIGSQQLRYDTIYAALSFSVMGLHPSFIQRILSGSDAPYVTKAIYFKTFVYLIFVSCLGVNGMIASLMNDQLNSSDALLKLIDVIIPAGFKGLILIGILASVMSTADSDLNISAISLVNDVLNPMGVTTKKTILVVTKLLSMIIGSSVILIVLKFQSIVDIVIFSAGFWVPVVVFPLIGIFFNIILSKKEFLLCAFIGSASFIYNEVIGSNTYVSSVFFASLMAFITFSTISLTKFLFHYRNIKN